MLRRLARLRRAAVPVVFVGLAACALPSSTGYVPSAAALNQLAVGLDTRESLGAIAGRPTTRGVIEDSGWYYVKSDFRQRGPTAPREIDREVVAVSFDERGVVRNVERYGLDDGRVVVLDRRVTGAAGADPSVIGRIFGNLGGFTPSGFIPEN